MGKTGAEATTCVEDCDKNHCAHSSEPGPPCTSSADCVAACVAKNFMPKATCEMSGVLTCEAGKCEMHGDHEEVVLEEQLHHVPATHTCPTGEHMETPDPNPDNMPPACVPDTKFDGSGCPPGEHMAVPDPNPGNMPGTCVPDTHGGDAGAPACVGDACGTPCATCHMGCSSKTGAEATTCVEDCD